MILFPTTTRMLHVPTFKNYALHWLLCRFHLDHLTQLRLFLVRMDQVVPSSMCNPNTVLLRAVDDQQVSLNLPLAVLEDAVTRFWRTAFPVSRKRLPV